MSDEARKEANNPRVTEESCEPDSATTDSVTQELIENVFPTADEQSTEVTCHTLLAAMPDEAFNTSPTEFSGILEGIFESEEELEATLNRCLAPAQGADGIALVRRVRALVPPEALNGYDASGFIDEVFAAFDEIEEVLNTLNSEARSDTPRNDLQTRAIVPESALSDPEEMIRTIDRLEDESQKLEVLFRQAKHALHHLRVYRLTKRPTGVVLNEMRQANHLPTLQYVVDFLSSIHQAANSFEQLDIPRPHIKDYLEYLYHLEDWSAMSDLVKRLESAVRRYWAED